LSLTSSGFFGGGQAGYNFQISRVVMGIEADIAGSGIEGKLRGRGDKARLVRDRSRACRHSGQSIRADLRNGWLGLRTYTSSLNATVAGVDVLSASLDHIKSGWTAGAGVEYAFTPYFTFKTE
jgi:outer membrane immunogenic protein